MTNLKQDIVTVTNAHTAISLLEGACALIEQANGDARTGIDTKARRWCREMRAEQVRLVSVHDAAAIRLHTPNAGTQPRAAARQRGGSLAEVIC